MDLVSLFDYVGNMGQEKGLVIIVLGLENKAGDGVAQEKAVNITGGERSVVL